MIIEEKKAADRICPQMIHTTPEYRWCQGSRCMAWRWADSYDADRVSESEIDITKMMSTTHGFCGLAGRP